VILVFLFFCCSLDYSRLFDDTFKAISRKKLFFFTFFRIFGHFEKPIFLKLCRHTEVLNVHAGAHLFKVGDPDENVFIVQSGLVSVNITSSDGSIITLKSVKTGDSVTSLLSFVDVLTVSV